MTELAALGYIALGFMLWGALLGFLHCKLRRHLFLKKTLEEQYEIAMKETYGDVPSFTPYR